MNLYYHPGSKFTFDSAHVQRKYPREYAISIQNANILKWR